LFFNSLQKFRKYHVLFLLALVIHACTPARFVPSGEHLLTKVSIHSDNRSLSKEEMMKYVRQKPNRKILYFFRFHLTVYNIAHIGNPGKWRTKIGNIIGEEPVLFDSVKMVKSKQQINTFLKNSGYYNALTECQIQTIGKHRRVNFVVTFGDPYIIEKVVIHASDPEIQQVIESDTANSYLTRGTIFSLDNLQKERTRITEQLKNKGYYFFIKEDISFDADTMSLQGRVNLTMKIQNDERTDSSGRLISLPHVKYSIDSVF
jgi:outer membrane protein assembly factor BamA